ASAVQVPQGELNSQDPGAPLVASGHRTKQRAGSGAGCVHVERPSEDRAIVEAISRAERTPQGKAVSVRDVDAQSLHQSGWTKPAGKPAAGAPTGEAGAASHFWEKRLEQVLQPANTRNGASAAAPTPRCLPAPASRARSQRVAHRAGVRSASLVLRLDDP